MSWEFDQDRPLYAQLIEKLQRAIVSGAYEPGAKIPSVRELAAEAGVNPNTMQKALTELEQQGLLNTQRTNGRYVTQDADLIAATRRQLAWDKVIAFLREMQALGFTEEACIQLMEESRNHG
ncbi:MAG: GntR family transcriptional regulator [Clostridiales bacterium]|nr:GntR family transcriptional regulator [Clostridiales bacterium]